MRSELLAECMERGWDQARGSTCAPEKILLNIFKTAKYIKNIKICATAKKIFKQIKTVKYI